MSIDTSSSSGKLLSYRFAITILLGSFLSFQIQPITARAILPWFGGGAMVWAACMLFFQAALLCGYLLAHLVVSRLRTRAQGIFILLLLVASVSTLGIAPRRPDDVMTAVETPVSSISLLLLRHIGLPYLTVALVSPLLQAWFGSTYTGRSPYRLYAVSNFGSLAALVSYPFLVEPLFGLRAQTEIWTVLYLTFSLCMGLCAAFIVFGTQNPAAIVGPDDARPGLSSIFVWVAISLLSSLTLLAVINRLTNEASVTPVLWVLPLALYLLSFILCFDSERRYRRSIYMPFFFFFALATGLSDTASPSGLLVEIICLCGLLFSVCMICHGELFRLRPATGHLTAFYLWISFGGALGGLSAAIIAPLLFHSYLEMPIAVVIVSSIVTAVIWSVWRNEPQSGRLLYTLMLGGAAGVTLSLAISLVSGTYRERATSLHLSRNFYGVLRVFEEDADDPSLHRIVLRHGNTVHGAQLVSPEKRMRPISYYSSSSPIGMVFRHLRIGEARRIGVLGLGVGTVAALAGERDYIRFYEIDPGVVNVARELFTYLRDSAAKTDIVLGDARLSLEKEPAQDFDILMIDTFSGDSVPVHLLTREALNLYRRHLSENGVIVVHISSRYFDLSPLLRGFARELGLAGGRISHVPESEEAGSSIYYLLTENRELLGVPEIADALRQSNRNPKAVAPDEIWTDDYSNIYMLLNAGRSEAGDQID